MVKGPRITKGVVAYFCYKLSHIKMKTGVTFSVGIPHLSRNGSRKNAGLKPSYSSN